MSGCGKTADAPKGAASAAPSRAASEGCEWAKFEAKGVGVSLLVEKCREEKFSVAEDGSGITMTRLSDGSQSRVVEVFAKREVQPVEAAIREQFVSSLPDKERMGCVVGPSSKMRVDRLLTLEILPGGAYMQEVTELRSKTPGIRPCGEYGEGDGLTFFLAQPEVTKTRFAFVRAGQDRSRFDETSVRLLPDSVADAALNALPVTGLAAGQRIASAVEARMDKLERKNGQFVSGDTNSTWTAFLDNGRVAMIVETQDAGEQGSGSLRYFYRDNKLIFLRESSLGATGRKSKQGQDQVLKVLAFGADNKAAGGRKTVNGKAEPIPPSEIDATVSRAAELLKRAQSAK